MSSVLRSLHMIQLHVSIVNKLLMGDVMFLPPVPWLPVMTQHMSRDIRHHIHDAWVIMKSTVWLNFAHKMIIFVCFIYMKLYFSFWIIWGLFEGLFAFACFISFVHYSIWGPFCLYILFFLISVWTTVSYDTFEDLADTSYQIKKMNEGHCRSYIPICNVISMVCMVWDTKVTSSQHHSIHVYKTV